MPGAHNRPHPVVLAKHGRPGSLHTKYVYSFYIRCFEFVCSESGMDFATVIWRTKAHVAEAMLLFPATDSFKLPITSTGTAPNALFMFTPGNSDTQPNKLGVVLTRGMMLKPYEPAICDMGACVSLMAKLLVHAVIVPYFERLSLAPQSH
jgi:hypothetical protein